MVSARHTVIPNTAFSLLFGQAVDFPDLSAVLVFAPDFHYKTA